MEKNFTNDSFEDFLRQSADGLRMRPDEKVWEGVTKDLNKRRRRYGWGLGFFLITACTLGYLSTNTVQRQSNSANSNATKNPEATTYQQQPSLPTLAFRNEALIEKSREGQRTDWGNSSGNRTPGLTVAVLNQSPALDAVQAMTQTPFELQPVDSDPAPAQLHATASTLTPQAEAAHPQSIESVVNSYKPGRAKRRSSLEWYFTPTISYRKLTENKSYLRSLQGNNSPYALIPASTDVNSMVTHKPGMGFEVGFAWKVPVSSKMRIRSGLQLNVTRYEIKAYNTQVEMATIRLNDRNAGPDSMRRFARIATSPQNQAFYSEDWIQNFYFQVSAPVGVEYDFAGNNKVQFGVAATIQPTYVLGDKSYLITADYKKYAEVPELSRRWNVNTALQTYVGYSTGKLNWQVGPQVRYQLLSSFATRYPVKENLFEYGLRVGISMNKTP